MNKWPNSALNAFIAVSAGWVASALFFVGFDLVGLAGGGGVIVLVGCIPAIVFVGCGVQAIYDLGAESHGS